MASPEVTETDAPALSIQEWEEKIAFYEAALSEAGYPDSRPHPAPLDHSPGNLRFDGMTYEDDSLRAIFRARLLWQQTHGGIDQRMRCRDCTVGWDSPEPCDHEVVWA